MRLNKYIWLAALPIAFTACQDDALVENPTGKGITTLSCSMEGGLPESRAQIVFGGTSTSAEYFHWNAGDGFTLFEIADENATPKEFEIEGTYSDESPSATAQFHIKDATGLTPGNNYVAYYPSTLTADGGYMYNVNISHEFKITEEGDEAAWKEYFQKNMYMKATGTVGSSSADTKLKFEHLCGLIRITYTNETNETITIGNIGTDGAWGSQLILSSGSDEIEDNLTDIKQLYLQMENVKVGPEESKDFYLLFIPPYGDSPTPLTYITIGRKTTPKTYMGETFSVSGFEAGQSYWFNVTDTGGETLEWTKELHSEEFVGTLEQHMECANFATLKAALASNIVEYITLTKDIVLLAPMEVNHPVTLDLNGKRLTLGESYTPDGTDAVFNMTVSSNDWRGIEIINGSIECAAGNMIQQYLFKLSGETVRLNLAGINISSGGTIPDIVYMDDDELNIHSSRNNEGESRDTDISTTGNVIYGETNTKGNRYRSNINMNGELNGDFYFKSNNGSLGQALFIQAGTINGDLTFEGIDEKFETKDYIQYHQKNVTIGEDYMESWKQARTFVDDQIFEVNTLDGLLEALSKNQILDEMTMINFRKTNDEGNEETFEISLKEPLTITKPVNINLNGNTLSLANDFDFGASDAAITNIERLSINGGTVKGSSTTTGKYLFKSTNNMNFNELTVNANDNLNAVYVDNASLYIYDNEKATNITVANNSCYAIYAKSSTKQSSVELNINGIITGNVHYELGCSNNEQLSQFRLVRGRIDGTWSTSGEYTDYLQMYFGPGSSVSENGDWPTALDILKQDMESDGTYWGKGGLRIEEEDITFELDTLFEQLDFVPGELTGSGTITFKQKVRSHNPQRIHIDIANLSDDIDFVFDGNFFKEIYVGSTQIQKAMNWANGSDRVEIRLNNDVTLTKQLVGEDMPLSMDNESSLQAGVFILNLNGMTLTSNVSSGAAIVWKGGVLEMNGGTFETAGDAIQVGAPLENDTHSGIDISLRSVTLNSTNGRCVYVDSPDTAESYKTVTINVMKNSVLNGKSASIEYNNNQYKMPTKEEGENLNVNIDETCELNPALKF